VVQGVQKRKKVGIRSSKNRQGGSNVNNIIGLAMQRFGEIQTAQLKMQETLIASLGLRTVQDSFKTPPARSLRDSGGEGSLDQRSEEMITPGLAERIAVVSNKLAGSKMGSPAAEDLVEIKLGAENVKGEGRTLS
jgi:hypothetical protein